MQTADNLGVGLGQIAEGAVPEGHGHPIFDGHGGGIEPQLSQTALDGDQSGGPIDLGSTIGQALVPTGFDGFLSAQAGGGGHAQQHAGGQGKHGRLETQRWRLGHQTVAMLRASDAPSGIDLQLQQAGLSHLLQLGTHGVDVQPQGGGDLGGGQRARGTDQLQIDGVARVVPKRLEQFKLWPTRSWHSAQTTSAQRIYTAVAVTIEPVTIPHDPAQPANAARSDSSTMAGPPATTELVLGLLRGVIDPELGADVVELGMIRAAVVDPDGRVDITVALTTAGCPLRAQIQKDIKHRVGTAPGVTSVKLHWTEMTAQERTTAMGKARWNARENAPETAIPATTRVIGIASGKGGVGKSSVTVNLAVALAQRGLRIGVLDADIWGFSVPRMLGLDGRLGAVPGEKKMVPNLRVVPGRNGGPGGVLEVVSMGLLTDDETDALMWRGLMLNRAVQHFLEDVRWGQLDYLLIDLPPGTGDVQMGLARMLPRTELLVITTPALAAQKVAARAATMARKSYLRVAGVVENMSAFVTPDGTSYALFGQGGGQALADDIGVALLASLPLDASVAAAGDGGKPVALGDGPMARAFAALAEVIVTEAVPPVDVSGCSARLLDAMAAAFPVIAADPAGPPEPAVTDKTDATGDPAEVLTPTTR